MRKLFFLAGLLFSALLVSAQRVWQWSSLTTLPPALYQKAMQKHQGIVVMDDLFPSVAQIGMGTVSKEAIRHRATHFPIDGFKRPHTGLMTYLHRRPLGVIDRDDDVNMFLLPNPGDTYFESFKATGKSKATEVEGEIDVMTAFWANIARQFPPKYAQASGFGPWVWEHHDYFDSRPHDYIEMHPMEQMWRADLINNRLQYNIALFSDNTGGDMMKWRPNPVITISAIAFEFVKGARPLEYVMEQKENFHAVPYPLFTDNAKVHVLMDGKDTLLTIREPAGTTEDVYSIDFAAVSKSGPVIGKAADSAKAIGGLPDIFKTKYTGFIKVHAAVKDGGHNMFSVTEKTRSITPPIQVQVQFVSLHCDAVDDDDNTEDLYGSYGVSASVGESPYHLNAYCPGAISTLWERPESNPLKLRKGQTSIINTVRVYNLSANGEVVVYGDLDEDDTGIGGGGDNDELSPPQFKRFAVKDMGIGTPVVVTDWYTSGGTKVNAIYIVKRLN